MRQRPSNWKMVAKIRYKMISSLKLERNGFFFSFSAEIQISFVRKARREQRNSVSHEKINQLDINNLSERRVHSRE